MPVNNVMFNGKRYHRADFYYPTRKRAERQADDYRKEGTNVIIDKRKAGYFFWIKDKTKKN